MDLVFSRVVYKAIQEPTFVFVNPRTYVHQPPTLVYHAPRSCQPSQTSLLHPRVQEHASRPSPTSLLCPRVQERARWKVHICLLL